MIGATFRVRAIGANLAARLGPRPRLGGQPRSVFARAVNLQAPDGSLLTLQGPGPLAAPFAVALEAWGGRPSGGDFALDLTGTVRVDLIVLPAREEETARAHLVAGLADTHPYATAPSLSSPRARAARAALAGAIRRRDAADFLDSARALIGLGEGLTPAGDDYLVGTLAVLHRLADGWPAAGAIARALTAPTGDTTTAVGAAFLRHAVAGEFSEPLRDLAMAESAAAARAAGATLARMGATSGADTLAGMRAALHALAGARA
jgi:hypothetical protein